MLHSTTSEDHLYQQSKRRIDAKASSENNCINNVCIDDAFFYKHCMFRQCRMTYKA